MVRITAAAALAFVAISSATIWDAADSGSLAARADTPASSPDDLQQLDTLIDAVATLSDMLKKLKQGTGGEKKEGGA
ncbi:hypothetical protein BBAD15_g9608 [Beauveria bassiana D1-5]|uniref:Uncharacterized protein n=2 Tax=Beauveria bassiana TaxID=176275 RepID=J4VTD9_BEAB2|nr:uncharacterized protein BBA_09230 [Beauveria bassiana ARSEF 2860]EJP61810.1 hypothetical protein BBA_09230 [Beauveria bassiana ARSEF 2860]KAF1729964.1 hypothetical protein CRV24_009421 [Beauveria bassiana]KAH8707683.1 hypothetical protein HC256_009859 [Beauveria bassiana]KGQ05149.1 hypothetical protein BBAD15_g9608 [Beauveria bassiana D1-5]